MAAQIPSLSCIPRRAELPFDCGAIGSGAVHKASRMALPAPAVPLSVSERRLLSLPEPYIWTPSAGDREVDEIARRVLVMDDATIGLFAYLNEHLFAKFGIDLMQDFGHTTPNRIAHLGLIVLAIVIFEEKKARTEEELDLSQRTLLALFAKLTTTSFSETSEASEKELRMSFYKFMKTQGVSASKSSIFVKCLDLLLQLRTKTPRSDLETSETTGLRDKYSVLIQVVAKVLHDFSSRIFKQFEYNAPTLKKDLQLLKGKLGRNSEAVKDVDITLGTFLKSMTAFQEHFSTPLWQLLQECQKAPKSALFWSLEASAHRIVRLMLRVDVHIPKLTEVLDTILRYERDEELRKKFDESPITVCGYANIFDLANALFSRLEYGRGEESIVLEKDDQERFVRSIFRISEEQLSPDARLVELGIDSLANLLSTGMKRIFKEETDLFVERLVKWRNIHNLKPSDFNPTLNLTFTTELFQEKLLKVLREKERVTVGILIAGFCELSRMIADMQYEIVRIKNERILGPTMTNLIQEKILKVLRENEHGTFSFSLADISEFSEAVSDQLVRIKNEMSASQVDISAKEMKKKVLDSTLKSMVENLHNNLTIMQSALPILGTFVNPIRDLQTRLHTDTRVLVDLDEWPREESKRDSSEARALAPPAAAAAAPSRSKKIKHSRDLKTLATKAAGPAAPSAPAAPAAPAPQPMRFVINRLLDEMVIFFSRQSKIPRDITTQDFLKTKPAFEQVVRLEQLQSMHLVQIAVEMLQDSRCFAGDQPLPCVVHGLIPALALSMSHVREIAVTRERLKRDPDFKPFHSLVALAENPLPLDYALDAESIDYRYPLLDAIGKQKFTHRDQIHLLLLQYVEAITKDLPVDQQYLADEFQERVAEGSSWVGSQASAKLTLLDLEEQRLLERAKASLNALDVGIRKIVGSLPARNPMILVLARLSKHILALQHFIDLTLLFPEQRYLVLSQVHLQLTGQYADEAIKRFILIRDKKMTEDSIFRLYRSAIHDLESPDVPLCTPLTPAQTLTLKYQNVGKGSEHRARYLMHHQDNASPFVLLVEELERWSKAGDDFSPRGFDPSIPPEEAMARLRNSTVQSIRSITEVIEALAHFHIPMA